MPIAPKLLPPKSQIGVMRCHLIACCWAQSPDPKLHLCALSLEMLRNKGDGRGVESAKARSENCERHRCTKQLLSELAASYNIYIYRAYPISQLHHYWSLRGYIYIQMKVIIWANFGQHLYKQLKVTFPCRQFVNESTLDGFQPWYLCYLGRVDSKFGRQRSYWKQWTCLHRMFEQMYKHVWRQLLFAKCLHMFAWLFNTKKWIPYSLLQAPKM